MTRKALVSFSLWTLVGTGGTLVALGPSSLIATDAPATEGRQAEPKIERDGTSLAIHLTNAGPRLNAAPGVVTLEPTDKPALKLIAQNTSAQNRQVGYTVRVTTSGPRNPMARTVEMPKTLWERGGNLDLVAGGEGTIDLTADVMLARGSSYTVELAWGDARIAPIRFVVPAANAQIVSAVR